MTFRTPAQASFLLLAALFTQMLASCSSSETSDDKIAEVKDYVLRIENGSPEINAEFRRLIADFNSRACIVALRLTDDPEEANSTITLKDIEDSEKDKIGYGQWKVRTSYADGLSDNYNVESYMTKHYSMNLEFDIKYVTARMGSEKPQDREDMQVLSFHEIGHGLQMDHENNPFSIMYPTVGGKKDLASSGNFFSRVRAFFDVTNNTGC